MEYVYAALLLHKLNKDITEDNVKNVIKATGASPDEVKIKALVAALSEVNIEESLKVMATPLAMAVPATAAADAGAAHAKYEKNDEKNDEKKVEDALEGLSSLFG